MQTTSGVADQNIHTAGFGCLDPVKDHCRRIGTFLMTDHAHTQALAPNLQLFCSRRTEGIRSCQKNGLSFGL